MVLKLIKLPIDFFNLVNLVKLTIPPATKITEDSAFYNDVFSFQPHLGSKETGFSTAEKVIFLTVSV
jgi:hypothetical protein